jgi:hypothetical protein
MEHQQRVALSDLERLLDQYGAVLRYLETDCVDISLVTRAERNLREEALAVIATLAQSAEQALAFDELARLVDELKLSSAHERAIGGRCHELLAGLCDGRPELAAFAWRVLSAFAELGRIVWALRLVDSMLRRRGPGWAEQMVERVRRNVLRTNVSGAGGNPLQNRTLQLGSKLALERIKSSPACSAELRPVITALLECVHRNIDRLDPPLGTARAAGRASDAHNDLMLAARPWERLTPVAFTPRLPR